MKTFLLTISLVFLGMTSVAQTPAPVCDTTDIKLNLIPKSSAACKALKIEGQYELKTCDNDQGLLISTDGTTRYIFKDNSSDNNIWGARQDSLDFTNKVSTSEIFAFNLERATFALTKSKQKQNGVYLRKINCRGMIESVAN